MQNIDQPKTQLRIEPGRFAGVARLQRVLHRIEDAALIGMLAMVLVLALAQIILRNLFEAGIVWGDVLVRILVLWLGLLGAMVASRNNEHICIDVLTRSLPRRLQNAVNCILALFAAAVCLIGAFASLGFVKMEYAFGTRAFAEIPTWLCGAVIPFAFGVIALRFFVRFIASLLKLIKADS